MYLLLFRHHNFTSLPHLLLKKRKQKCIQLNDLNGPCKLAYGGFSYAVYLDFALV